MRVADFTQDPSSQDGRPFRRFVVTSVLALAIFLWLKLKLVSPMPKTAYAEPDRATPPVAGEKTQIDRGSSQQETIEPYWLDESGADKLDLIRVPSSEHP